MAKYRKKPVVIEATVWFKNGDHPEDGTEVFESGEFKGELLEGKVVRYFRHPEVLGANLCNYCGKTMHHHGWIDTVQGGHIVCPGDWIITDNRVKKDQHGYYYPCKPDVFAATYEEIDLW